MGQTAWSAPAVLIVGALVMLISDGILVCSSQRFPTLPSELTLPQLRNKFCNTTNGCPECGLQCMCTPPNCTLCQQICPSGLGRRSRIRCWNDAGLNEPECRDGQTVRCRYQDAVVCTYDDGRGSCVFATDRDPYCICTGAVVTETADGCDSLGSTPPAPLVVVAVVLGSISSFVLILVILAAMVWCLRRKGKLPAFTKKNPKCTKQSSVEMNTRALGRPSLPEVPTRENTEYSYAYDHRSQDPTNLGTAKTVNLSDDEDHYYSIEEQERDRYVRDGPGGGKPPGTNTSTEATDQYTALRMSDDGAVSPHNDGRTPEADGAAVESPADNDDYFPLVKTPEPPSGDDDDAEYQVPNAETTASDDGDNDDEDASAPYDHLARDNGNRSNEGALIDKDDTGDDYQHAALI